MLLASMILKHALSGTETGLLRVKIWNTRNQGAGTPTMGTYAYEIRGRKGHLMKTGTIHRFPRKSQHAIKLLQKVINDAYPEFST